MNRLKKEEMFKIKGILGSCSAPCHQNILSGICQLYSNISSHHPGCELGFYLISFRSGRNRLHCDLDCNWAS